MCNVSRVKISQFCVHTPQLDRGNHSSERLLVETLFCYGGLIDPLTLAVCNVSRVKISQFCVHTTQLDRGNHSSERLLVETLFCYGGLIDPLTLAVCNVSRVKTSQFCVHTPQLDRWNHSPERLLVGTLFCYGGLNDLREYSQFIWCRSHVFRDLSSKSSTGWNLGKHSALFTDFLRSCRPSN